MTDPIVQGIVDKLYGADDDIGEELDNSSTTGSEWNHWICEACWTKREPSRWPVRIQSTANFGGIPVEEVAFICCFCGAMAWSHILVRDDPGQRHCRHDAYVTNVSPQGEDDDAYPPDMAGPG